LNERNDIDYPIWRKKVDSSFLNDTVTPIPKWLWEVWDIEEIFDSVRSKNDTHSEVTIYFDGDTYKGNVTFSTQTGGRTLCRLHFALGLHSLLKERFLMTYMRSLEGQIRKSQGSKQDIELVIPFWEFIDIEFDCNNKHFIFTCHYNQQPIFPELFKKLISSPSIKIIDDELNGKETHRIQKQDWKPRAEYKTEIGAENVIYTLIDTQNQLIYVGEAKKLIARFDNGHPDIKSWDYYRYNVLPKSLEEFRVTIERMAIRDLAGLLTNKSDISKIEISPYKLANRKIDL